MVHRIDPTQGRRRSGFQLLRGSGAAAHRLEVLLVESCIASFQIIWKSITKSGSSREGPSRTARFRASRKSLSCRSPSRDRARRRPLSTWPKVREHVERPHSFTVAPVQPLVVADNDRVNEPRLLHACLHPNLHGLEHLGARLRDGPRLDDEGRDGEAER